MKRLAASVCILALTVSTVPAQERVDLDMVTKIRLEGFTNSKVMETASELMDRIGPRLTGSPQMKEANEWTKERLSGWGLANARLESWGPFGRGWTWEGCSVRMIAPDKTQLVAIPEAWTAGTSGPIRGAAARLNIKEVSELEGLKGRFGGKIVFFGEARDIGLRQKPDSHRYDEEELEAEFLYQMPGGPPRYNRAEYAKRREIRKAVNKFLDEEKALAIVSPGRGDMGTFNVQGGGTWKKGDPQGLPSLSMEPEHFGRVARLLDRSVPVEIEMDVQARFIEEDLMQWNTIAEIPGGDKKDEIVMVGAHLDSWHGATGATDNGAGSVVAMEAMRILKAVGVKPRRTIRIGLWSGEEQALYGSRAYVSQHFASRPEPSPEEKEKPFYLRKKTGPLTVKPEHAKLSVYFNLDNGSGKIRGIYCEDNAAVAPIFREWLEPFADLGATLVTLNQTGGTDHGSFDEVGLPGFQFVQDDLEYETRTHHTNMDLYERLQKNDLMQASVIMAAFAYNAAMRDGMIPRKPMPKDEPAKGEPGKAAPAPAKAQEAAKPQESEAAAPHH
ncbi:MAG: M20/M25/M40 family metallo-hydrolase [Thermoanaerobaculia bacterium]